MYLRSSEYEGCSIGKYVVCSHIHFTIFLPGLMLIAIINSSSPWLSKITAEEPQIPEGLEQLES